MTAFFKTFASRLPRPGLLTGLCALVAISGGLVLSDRAVDHDKDGSLSIASLLSLSIATPERVHPPASVLQPVVTPHVQQ